MELEDGNRVISEEKSYNINCDQATNYVVYPNPLAIKEQFWIVDVNKNDFFGDLKPKKKGTFKLLLYSAKGQLLLTEEVPEVHNVSIQAPAEPGLYLLKIIRNGQSVLTQKLRVRR